MIKSMVSILVVSLAVFAIGCENEAMPLDDNGNTRGTSVPAAQCATGGTACSGEGAQCGENKCHCGTWINRTNPQCNVACTQPQAPNTCPDGATCSGEGNTCDSKKVCHCGRWLPMGSALDLLCPGTSNPGTGGTGGSSGAGGSSGTGGTTAPASGNPGGLSGTATATFTIMAPSADHVWCEGAAVIVSDVNKSDAEAKWTGQWRSFGCDSFNGYYVCNISYNPAVERPRFQCYLDESGEGTASSPDKYRYTCANPSMLKSGETFSSSASYQLVTNLNPSGKGENCQIL